VTYVNVYYGAFLSRSSMCVCVHKIDTL